MSTPVVKRRTYAARGYQGIMNTIKRYGRGRTGKILATCAVIGAAGAFAGIATFSAFSSSTTNSGNSFAAGSVTIGDNDAGSAMYVLANQKRARPRTSASR